MSKDTIMKYRQEYYDYFIGKGQKDIPPPTKTKEWGDHILQIVKNEREFCLYLSEDVSWGPDLSGFIEKADEWVAYDKLEVEAPNTLEGFHKQVFDLYKAWVIDKLDIENPIFDLS